MRPFETRESPISIGITIRVVVFLFVFFFFTFFFIVYSTRNPKWHCNMCVPTPVRDNRGRWFELGHPTLWALTREFISPYVYRQTVLSTTFDLERIWTHGEREYFDTRREFFMSVSTAYIFVRGIIEANATGFVLKFTYWEQKEYLVNIVRKCNL